MGSHEDDVRAAFSAVLQRLNLDSYEDLVEALSEVERRFAGVLEEREALEVRRRVAEYTLMVARDKDLPVERCEELLAQVEMLGWSDPHAKALVVGAFARYCLDHGRSDIGWRHLSTLIPELEEARRRTPDPVYDADLDSVNALAAQLRTT